MPSPEDSLIAGPDGASEGARAARRSPFRYAARNFPEARELARRAQRGAGCRGRGGWVRDEEFESGMKAPESLETLLDYGIIQEVVRPLMSGKEAQVYLVVAGGTECVAKVYKEASQRTFKHRSDYTEGRRTRNSRDQRAMTKRTRHGRQKDEDAWRSTEVDMIYRLRDAGVRVPAPFNFVEGVLVMELVKDAEGRAASRLGDLSFSPAEAREIYEQLIREVIRMLCAGVIHGDLSVFNVLMAADGPVVIDFPQAIDPTHNRNGEKIFLRDVENLQRFIARFDPAAPLLPYGQEIWQLFQANRLRPDTELTGGYRAPEGKADTSEVMSLIEDAQRDEARRRRGPRSEDDDEEEEDFRQARQAPVSFRKVVDFTSETGGRQSRGRPRGNASRRSGASSRERPSGGVPVPPSGPAATSKTRQADAPSRGASPESPAEPVPKKRRRSRRGRSLGASSSSSSATPAATPRRGAGEDAARPPSGPKGRAQGGRGATTQPAHDGSAGRSSKNSSGQKKDGGGARDGVDSDRPPRRRRRRSGAPK